MKKAFKTAALYVGTAIGAGFSSGREIALFFGDASPVNVAISSVFMSLLCALFLVAGKQKMIPKGALVKLGVFLAASISLCAMLAGGDFITYSMTGIPPCVRTCNDIACGTYRRVGYRKNPTSQRHSRAVDSADDSPRFCKTSNADSHPSFLDCKADNVQRS